MKSGKDRFTTAMEQHKVLNRLKQTDFPWMYEVSKCAPQEALRDLQRAFNNFLHDPNKVGFPKFKKKGQHESFRLTGSIKVHPDQIQLPKLGILKLKENVQYFLDKSSDIHIQSATVSQTADRWYVSLTVQEDLPDPQEPRGIVGIDLGLKEFATLSIGETIPPAKPCDET
jgi:putative transposase